MEICTEADIHPERTRLNDLAYCFTPKHHGSRKAGDKWGIATWLPEPELTRPEEFGVFEMADTHQLADQDGNLYGLRIRNVEGGREIFELGIWHEMIARFWHEDTDTHWHGHPLWRVGEGGPPNRTKQKYCPPKIVFDRMIAAGLVTAVQTTRLKIGKHLKTL